MSEHIWKELRGVVRHASGQTSLLSPQAENKKCGASRDDKPICRVQDKLYKEPLRTRAVELAVPDTGDRWLLWTACVFCGVSAVACILGPAFWKEVDRWWGAGGRFDFIIQSLTGPDRFTTYSFLSIAAFFAANSYSSAVLARSKNSLFRYKVFLPVPDQFTARLKWDYYLSTAIPAADVETIAAAGGGKTARLSARFASKYQGAITMVQARIKCKDAINFVRGSFKAGAKITEGTKDVERMTAAGTDITEADDILKGVRSLMSNNAITVARLHDVAEIEGATDKLKSLASRVLASRAVPYIAPGNPNTLPADPAYLDQMSITLEVALPKISEADARMKAALEGMRSLGERLRPTALSLRYNEDPRYSDALKEALSTIPDTGTGADALRAVRSMTDEGVLKVDAALAVASATMDYTILPYARGGDRRIDSVSRAYFGTFLVVSGMWAGIGAEALVRFLWNDAIQIISDERKKKNLSGTVVLGLNYIVRGLVTAIIIAATYFQFRGNLSKYAIDELARIQTLEGLGASLRRMVELGGTRAVLKNSSEFTIALKQLDEAMVADVLTEKNAHARMPVRISTMVVGVTVVGCAAMALVLMARSMQPHKDFARMRMLHDAVAKPMDTPMAGGALSEADIKALVARDTEVLIDASIPDLVRAPVTVTAIVALTYYLVLMIMTEHRTRDLYVTQLTMDRQQYSA